MARPRKPAAQRKREGNAGKRPILEPWDARGIGAPPEHLWGDALDFWNTHVRDLDGVGILDVTDRPMIEVYCLTWQRFCVASRELASGWYIRGSTGQARLTHMLQEQANASRDLLRIAGEYGATAAARARIDRGAGGNPPDPWEDLPENPRLRAIEGGRS